MAETRDRQHEELARMLGEFCAWSLVSATKQDGFAGAVARLDALKRRGRALLRAWGYTPHALPDEQRSDLATVAREVG